MIYMSTLKGSVLALALLAVSACTHASTPDVGPVLVVENGATLRPSLAPCAEEDSPGPCFWDAADRGNGKGQSFVVTAGQNVRPITAAKAAALTEGSKR